MTFPCRPVDPTSIPRSRSPVTIRAVMPGARLPSLSTTSMPRKSPAPRTSSTNMCFAASLRQPLKQVRADRTSVNNEILVVNDIGYCDAGHTSQVLPANVFEYPLCSPNVDKMSILGMRPAIGCPPPIDFPTVTISGITSCRVNPHISPLHCKCYPAEPARPLKEVIDELIGRQLV